MVPSNACSAERVRVNWCGPSHLPAAASVSCTCLQLMLTAVCTYQLSVPSTNQQSFKSPVYEEQGGQ